MSERFSIYRHKHSDHEVRVFPLVSMEPKDWPVWIERVKGKDDRVTLLMRQRTNSVHRTWDWVAVEMGDLVLVGEHKYHRLIDQTTLEQFYTWDRFDGGDA